MPSSLTETLINELRQRDYRRFLAIQRAPQHSREVLYAITAYYNELAYITESTSEPAIAAIRFAWWREGVQALAAGKPPREHPTMQAIAACIQAGTLSPDALLGLISAREVELDHTLLQSESQFMAYLDNTAGALHQQWLKLLGAEGEQQMQATQRISRAYALLGLLCAMPYYIARNQQRFAHEMLPSSQEENALTLFVSAQHTAATAMLEQAKSAQSVLPKPIRVLAAYACADARRLQRSGFNPQKLAEKGRSPLHLVWLAINA